MNILILNLGKEYGGAEKVIENICKYSSNNIFLGIINGTKFCNKQVSFEKTIVLEQNKKHTIHNIIKIIKFIKKNKIELIHCHGVFAEVIGIMIKIILRKTIITTIHSRADFDTTNVLKGKIYIAIQKVLRNFNKYYIVVSDELEDLFKFKNTKKIYNGIEESQLIKGNFKQVEQINIISVGRLTHVKAHKNLIRALAGLKEQNIRFRCTLLGDGELRADLENQVKELDLSNYVKFEGFVDDIKNYLNESDCLIMNSYMEGVPITILEAMSCRLPILTNKVGGIKNILREQDFIELKSNESIDIEAGIVKFIKSEEAYINKMVDNAYENFKKNYSVKTFIKNQDGIYNDC